MYAHRCQKSPLTTPAALVISQLMSFITSLGALMAARSESNSSVLFILRIGPGRRVS